MKILTFQHKDVWEKIKSGDTYIATIDSFYRKNTPNCYKIVFDDIQEKYCDATQPIFGWYSAFKSDGTDIVVNDETISRCLNMVGFDANNYLAILLDINDNEVSLQNFYRFVDARCEEEGIDCEYDNFEDFPIDEIFDINDVDEIQATFSYIKMKFVNKVYRFEATTTRTSYVLVEEIFSSKDSNIRT